MQEAEIRVEMTCMQRSRNLPTTTPFFSKGLHIYTPMTGSITCFRCNNIEKDSVGGMSIEAPSSICGNHPGLRQIQQANHTSKAPKFDKLLLHIYLTGLKNGLAKILMKIE
jgi:hypothetical protein